MFLRHSLISSSVRQSVKTISILIPRGFYPAFIRLFVVCLSVCENAGFLLLSSCVCTAPPCSPISETQGSVFSRPLPFSGLTHLWWCTPKENLCFQPRGTWWSPASNTNTTDEQEKKKTTQKTLQWLCRPDDTCVWRRAPLCKMMRALNGVLGDGFYEIKGAGGLENRTGLNVSWLDLPQMNRTWWLYLQRFERWPVTFWSVTGKPLWLK